MRIHPVETRELNGKIRISCAVDSVDGHEELWYELDSHYAPYLVTDRHDAFVVALLYKAMQLGEELHIDGVVSTRLYFSLQSFVVPLLRILVPSLPEIRLRATALDATPLPCQGGVATGFSAGIDSFAAIYDHLVTEPPVPFRLTHFLFNNVGSHGTTDLAQAGNLFLARQAAIRGYPESLNMEFIGIDSNLHIILKAMFDTTHVLRNVSCVLLLQGLFSRYCYATTFRYGDAQLAPDKDIAVMEPVLLPLLSTETTDCMSTGGQHSRVEKTRRMARVPGAGKWLNVCGSGTSTGGNCSVCYKCMRTLFTLEALGMLEDFAGVFDLGKWRKVRNRYISVYLMHPGHKRPLTRENLVLARETGYRFTAWQRFAGLLIWLLPAPLYRLGRSVRRRYLGGV